MIKWTTITSFSQQSISTCGRGYLLELTTDLVITVDTLGICYSQKFNKSYINKSMKANKDKEGSLKTLN